MSHRSRSIGVGTAGRYAESDRAIRQDEQSSTVEDGGTDGSGRKKTANMDTTARRVLQSSVEKTWMAKPERE